VCGSFDELTRRLTELWRARPLPQRLPSWEDEHLPMADRRAVASVEWELGRLGAVLHAIVYDPDDF
jgi:hypothetical protein